MKPVCPKCKSTDLYWSRVNDRTRICCNKCNKLTFPENLSDLAQFFPPAEAPQVEEWTDARIEHLLCGIMAFDGMTAASWRGYIKEVLLPSYILALPPDEDAWIREKAAQEDGSFVAAGSPRINGEVPAPSGWRDVKVELPEDSKARIVWVPEYRNKFTACWKNGKWTSFSPGCSAEIYGVTHWTDTPAAPPEGQSKEQR